MDSVDSQIEETAAASPLTQPYSKRGPKGDWPTRFLRYLSKNSSVSDAARRAGVSRVTVYQHRANNIEFANAWQDALEQAYDALEGDLYDRGRRDDTQAAIFLLKGYRAQKFADRHKVEVGSAGEFDFDFTQLTPEERAQLDALTKKAIRK
jgi:hypothetical protein